MFEGLKKQKGEGQSVDYFVMISWIWNTFGCFRWPRTVAFFRGPLLDRTGQYSVLQFFNRTPRPLGPPRIACHLLLSLFVGFFSLNSPSSLSFYESTLHDTYDAKTAGESLFYYQKMVI